MARKGAWTIGGMTFLWLEEKPARWDTHKARIIGEAPPGSFDARFRRCKPGDLLPGEWWRVEHEGRAVGYGWLDVVWGDAEITVASDPAFERRGVGTFILSELEREARQRGLNNLYNIVRPTHPRHEDVSGWLERRGFRASEDGGLFRRITSRA